jgi:hypothetical protein
VLLGTKLPCEDKLGSGERDFELKAVLVETTEALMKLGVEGEVEDAMGDDDRVASALKDPVKVSGAVPLPKLALGNPVDDKEGTNESVEDRVIVREAGGDKETPWECDTDELPPPPPPALCVAPGLIEGVPPWEGRGEEEVDKEARDDTLGALLFVADMDALREEDTEALVEREGVARAVMVVFEDCDTERELKGDWEVEREPSGLDLDAKGLLEIVAPKDSVKAAGEMVAPLALTPPDFVG